jgi:hypothetical protein
MKILDHEIQFIETDNPEWVDMEMVSSREFRSADDAAAASLHMMCYIYNEGILSPGAIRHCDVKDNFGNIIYTSRK